MRDSIVEKTSFYRNECRSVVKTGVVSIINKKKIIILLNKILFLFTVVVMANPAYDHVLLFSFSFYVSSIGLESKQSNRPVGKNILLWKSYISRKN